MKKTWYEIYMDEINEKGTMINYVNDKIKNKKALIDLVKKYSPNKKIIESGSGTGILSTYFASLGFNVLAIDIDREILDLSKKIAKQYPSSKKPKFKIDSILELKYKSDEFDVSFSNGVLEHFSDDEIILSLKKQLKISKTVIMGIPTKYFDDSEAMYGDERFMSYKFWRDIIKEAGGVIIEEKSYHYMGKFQRIFDFKKYFRPFPFRVFVIKKDQS